jgi:hypothetical protein
VSGIQASFFFFPSIHLLSNCFKCERYVRLSDISELISFRRFNWNRLARDFIYSLF